MNLLAIETSSDYLSLAVAGDAGIHSFHQRVGQRHAELVLDEIARLLRAAGMAMADLQGIAYGKGPGSFTGLRIACGVTQGLAFALGVPVRGVVTLESLAEECHATCGARRVIACIDARMGEVYHASYQREGDEWQVVSAPGLYAPGDLPAAPGVTDEGWTGCGTAFNAYAPVLSRRYPALERTLPELVPSARAALALARPGFEAGRADPAQEALPLYIRDKVALTKDEQG